MRIVFISDTHGKHSELGTLHGDVLVHSGDFCDGYMNDGRSLAEIDDWFAEQHFDLILCVEIMISSLKQSIRLASPFFKTRST